MNNKKFSIVVPVYQNSKNLPVTMPTLLGLQDQLPGWQLELIFVDDGSRDDSLVLLNAFAVKNPEQVKVVKLTRNFGQNPAIQAGLRYACGDCVGIISADLQEPCEMFVDMIHEWEKGAKFVIGKREDREEGWLHRLISGLYWRLIRCSAFPELPDLGYDFCLLDRQVVEDINHINEKNSPIFILLYWLGYRPVQLPIVRKIRDKGHTQWKLLNKIKLTIDTLIGFTYLPARIISLMGLISASLCILILIYLFMQYFLLGLAPPGWTTVVGLVTLFSAMILFSLGIVSEYLLRILDEARKRPPYVIERLIAKKDIEIQSHDK